MPRRLIAGLLLLACVPLLSACADDHLAYVEACIDQQGLDPAQVDWDHSSARQIRASDTYDVRIVGSGGTTVLAECSGSAKGDSFSVSS